MCANEARIIVNQCSNGSFVQSYSVTNFCHYDVRYGMACVVCASIICVYSFDFDYGEIIEEKCGVSNASELGNRALHRAFDEMTNNSRSTRSKYCRQNPERNLPFRNEFPAIVFLPVTMCTIQLRTVVGASQYMVARMRLCAFGECSSEGAHSVRSRTFCEHALHIASIPFLSKRI